MTNLMSGIRPIITPNPVTDDEAPPCGDGVEAQLYFVLRQGEILGPFTFKRLIELTLAKTVSRDDFVQESGSFEWVPLRWVLDPDNAPREDGAHAPQWKTLISWCWMRLRYNLDERSLPAGLTCLGLSIAGLLLSRWPSVFWAPWSVLAFVAGIALYRRGRVAAGISLMLASAVVPVGIWGYFFR
jgi:GYF domain 2